MDIINSRKEVDRFDEMIRELNRTFNFVKISTYKFEVKNEDRTEDFIDHDKISEVIKELERLRKLLIDSRAIKED